jgi:hypothetical protein
LNGTEISFDKYLKTLITLCSVEGSLAGSGEKLLIWIG